MSANNITQKVQQAAKAYLDSEDLSFITDEETQIVCGISRGEMNLTQVVCQCKSADAEVPWEGNWSALLRVEIRSQADDDDEEGAAHFANAGEVFEKFMVSITAGRSALSNQTIGFTCQQLLPVNQGWEIEGGSWVSYMELRLECAGTYFDVS